MKPTCWYHPVSGRVRFDGDSLGPSWIPLYKHHEWVGLTWEERHGLYKKSGLIKYHHPDSAVQYNYDRCLDDYASSIEAKLKAKNS